MTTETPTDPWDDLAGPSTRAPRSLDTREKSERRRSWAPPTMLPDPIPQDGYVFKWVRSASRGTPDHSTYQKRIREGWEPVRAEDYPELMTEIGVELKTGLVEVGGLILCKMPSEMVKQRADYYRGVTVQQQSSAEEHYMRDSHELMRKVKGERNKRVFFDRPERS